MIERFYLKDFLSFKELSLEFDKGLVVFSGASGSGKSLLMLSILSSLGFDSCDANVCSSSVSYNIDEFDEDLLIFKHSKKDKSRYFINNQNLSKKSMLDISSRFVKHLSLRDFSDFENERLLDLLDDFVAKKTPLVFELKAKLQESFVSYKKLSKELDSLRDEQKRVVELKEFASFEISKIDSIKPKLGEDEELLEIKKELSKKEKLTSQVLKSEAIFNYEGIVVQTLEQLGEESGFFSDALNELRVILDSANDRFSMLEEIDIESVLNRLEEIAELKRRYGSIEEALEYREKKFLELKKYENIEYSLDELQSEVLKLKEELDELSTKLRELRVASLNELESELNIYLRELYLRDATLKLNAVELSEIGIDELVIEVANTSLKQLSTGEFNRLRLALLAIKAKFLDSNGGVLFLDEVDANLSGEESMSVAKVLKELSKNYQIFAISHQSQLSSLATQHFLVYKEDEISFAKELSFDERVDEIARIISGDKITNEARAFAREVLDVSRYTYTS